MIVIGAGMGGLSAAIDLAQSGARVSLFEATSAPGGKMRVVSVNGAAVDSGPTVFTMGWVFEQLFAEAGADFWARVPCARAKVLARHHWRGGAMLDLPAAADAARAAIAAFAGEREADGFDRFRRDAARAYAPLREAFMTKARPSPVELARRLGPSGLGALMAVNPFARLEGRLRHYFRDPRLRQLFGRYATYSGASPYAAPATLMVIAHVELDGVWHVAGGMIAVAAAMAALAAQSGAVLRYDSPVAEILTRGGKAAGVKLASGEEIPAEAVLFNGDPDALRDGLLGAAARDGGPRDAPRRSLSALTWSIAAQASGFTLLRHNVFFSDDYRAEFDALFGRGEIPADPTLYVCAQDQGDAPQALEGPQRLFVLANAPARGDQLTQKEVETCETRMRARLAEAGLAIDWATATAIRTSPDDFARRFPGSAGALYGRAIHGPLASFTRPASRTRLAGLYLAGGATHPSAGVPMATLSGRLAALQIATDLGLRRPSRPAAISGSISTPSAPVPATG